MKFSLNAPCSTSWLSNKSCIKKLQSLEALYIVLIMVLSSDAVIFLIKISQIIEIEVKGDFAL
jgi:hypothetical protein